MTAAPSPHPSRHEPARERPTVAAPRATVHPWVWRAALAFVLLTLATLVLVPMVVWQRVGELREAIAIAEPARTLLARLQFNLVREVMALDARLHPDDPGSVGSYAAVRAAEREILTELTPLVTRLGPDVMERFVEARALAERWHTRVDDGATARTDEEIAGATRLETEPGLLEEVIRSTSAVDGAILRTTARLRAEIDATERLGLRLTAVLGLLAFLAAGAAAALHARLNRIAMESATRRAQAEGALAELARADEARRRILRGVTHDVRNPLGAARGYAELLALGTRAPMSPEQAPLVAGVQRSIDSALAIIADLLDVARVDGGVLTVHRVPTDLASVARAAVDDHRGAAEAAGLAMHFEPAMGPVHVYTDPARVRQVLDNLLSNAIKYTPTPGRVTVRAELASDSGAPRAGRWAVVRVTDTGPGIPPEQREVIFEEFGRLDGGGSVPGYGLGLTIARRIARLLGGDLSIADTVARGATFVLWLPLRDQERATTTADEAAG